METPFCHCIPARKFERAARKFVDSIRDDLVDDLREYANGDLVTTYEVASAMRGNKRHRLWRAVARR